MVCSFFMTKTIIITAAGKGLRMGADLPKQFLPIAGKPILQYTIEQFYNYDNAMEIILVLPEDHIPYWQLLINDHNFTIPHQLVEGGETRYHSIKNGLEYATGEVIGVHDGVRPFASQEVISSVFAKAEITGSAIPVLPLVDSIRELHGQSSTARDRSRFVSVQTPQCFKSAILKSAYSTGYNELFTDDASVVEANGQSIHLIEGNRENIKITTPFDLEIAKILLKA
jgi:2-C-methyl-D-erythritol 4-phosphate cytidylyltransferase